jgi:translation initiation factor 2B subunit (eIF-2B alpha/beta/delta family)
MKYAPVQLGAVEDQLQQVKDSYARGDYKAVVAAAPALTAAINGLKDAATAKQAEQEAALAKAKDDWGPTSTSVPKMVDAIQSRVDILSKSHHLPKGVTKESLAAAKTGLDAMKSSWGEATTAAGSGDFTTAMSKAQAVKDQATKIMQSLGMTSG